MVIGYARVSTDDQKLEAQLRKLKEAGCERVYKEKVSGASQKRAELENVLSYVREGDVIAVTKLDRLGRSMTHLVKLIERLRKKGVDLKVLDNSIDTSDAQGRLVFGIFSALAEFERELISERTREGLAQARKNGEQLGRPRKLESAEDVRKLQTLIQADDISVKSIAEDYGVTRQTLYNYVAPDGSLRKQGKAIVNGQ